jgi:predicted alpha/beta-fold hydrolase
LQTLWPTFFRSPPRLPLRRERIELVDGDFVDLDWTTGASSGPIVLVLHGLEGSSASPYALGLLGACQQRGWRGGVLHFRGCSGVANRLDRGYHSGDTADLEQVVSRLRGREAQTPLVVVGYSLGGNVLLKWLGERPGARRPVRAAVAISVPFDLAGVADRLERGASRVYQWHLVRAMRASVLRKFHGRPAPVDLAAVARARTFRSFDDAVTAPLHGFAGVDDYYARASCRQFLSGIATPTLIVHALDDPFTTPAIVPRSDELPAAVRLEVSEHGGHVGFIGEGAPCRPRYWLEERIPAFVGPYVDGPPPAEKA